MFRILTDSSAGFSIEDAQKIGVEMVFLSINFDGKEFLDVKELTHEQFYVELKASKNLPKTSAVNQTAFEEIFQDVKKKGDEMIVILIAKELSATMSQAFAAQKATGYNKIHVIDTQGGAITEIALVMEAVRMRDERKSFVEIVAEIDRLAPKCKLFAYVDTFKYLRAGGRVSATSATIGTIIGIKPIVTLVGGIITNCRKTIGVRKAHEFMISQLGKADLEKPVYFGHANAKADCEKFCELAKQRHTIKDGGCWFISATIATHSGPGAGGIAFFEK